VSSFSGEHYTVLPLIIALSRNLESLPYKDDSEQLTELKLILFLLTEKVDTEKKQFVTELIVSNIRFLDVVARFVQWLSDEQTAVTWGLQRLLRLDEIKALVFKRFKNEYVDKPADVFALTNNPVYILYQIGTYSVESCSVINDYVFGLLSRTPKYIGQLIGSFLIEFTGPGPGGFQMEALQQVYDVPRLLDLAEKAGADAVENDKQQRAVDIFVGLAKDRATKSQGVT
jgi:hypothetical protein